MSVPLYTDVHVHQAIADGLRLRGIDVLTAREDDADELEDSALLDRVTRLDRVIVTYDDDFVREARRRQEMSGEHFSGIVYSPQSQVRIGPYVDQLEVIASVMTPDEMRDRVLFLPL